MKTEEGTDMQCVVVRTFSRRSCWRSMVSCSSISSFIAAATSSTRNSTKLARAFSAWCGGVVMRWVVCNRLWTVMYGIFFCRCMHMCACGHAYVHMCGCVGAYLRSLGSLVLCCPHGFLEGCQCSHKLRRGREHKPRVLPFNFPEGRRSEEETTRERKDEERRDEGSDENA